ncbi:MAG: hypothetical protein JF622_02680 [Terrabacter sp.]|nr:hypothetical protein [Terrabacter sp.]
MTTPPTPEPADSSEPPVPSEPSEPSQPSAEIYGGLGALADHWLGTTWLVGVGIVGGMALSLYLIWFRYGTH